MGMPVDRRGNQLIRMGFESGQQFHLRSFDHHQPAPSNRNHPVSLSITHKYCDLQRRTSMEILESLEIATKVHTISYLVRIRPRPQGQSVKIKQQPGSERLSSSRAAVR